MKEKGLDKYVIFTIILSALLILSNFIVKYVYNLFGHEIIFSTLVYPFVFLFANFITRDYGSKKTIITIIVAMVIQAIVYLVTTEVGTKVFVGSLVSFATSQIISLGIYVNILKNNNNSFLKLFLTYTLVLIIDIIVFYLISGNSFDAAFLIENCIRTLMALILTLFSAKNSTK